jgi:2-oxoisovalerate dehydrogenase E1 component
MSPRPDDLHTVEAALLASLDAIDSKAIATTDVHDVDPMLAATWLEAEVTSRVLDHTARWLRAERGIGYYTIGSAGHESNAVVATAVRVDDPALLHYRSGAFYVARSLMAAATGVDAGDPVVDVLRGMLARSTDGIAGGRHKVFGNHALSIIPQTSTIASHLPRAVGLALSGTVAPKAPTVWPRDMVVVCSFGDGSLNHSTAQGALNWAAHAAHSGQRVPILFVCEDNGLGLSVPTPVDWVRSSLTGRPGLTVAAADGADPVATWRATVGLVDEIRRSGRPGVLHLSTVRFLGHAGTDVESAYRSAAQMNADLSRDPIIGAARVAAACDVCSPADAADWYMDVRDTIRLRVASVSEEPELLTVDEVTAPLAALHAPTARRPLPSPDARPRTETIERFTMAQSINRCLAELIDTSHDVVVFGEDVGRKGGAYGVTRGLQKRFGDQRVFDMLLDEQSILGMALGAALNGRLPVPEIQYLAYLHNAEDQLRGEAATLGFFSCGQYRNPMVVRIAGYGYQKGFGGHFHNDNSIAVLRDIPGLVIASPAHPADAAPLLRACVAHARETGAVCVYLEPIARYHDADLYELGDGGWTSSEVTTTAGIGRARSHDPPGDGPCDITILTWANGTYLSMRAQRRLAADHGIRCRVVDLRWIAPLPVDDMVEAAEATGRVLVVDETRRSGGVGEGIVTALVERSVNAGISRVSAADSFVPLGAAANLVLVSENGIVEAAVSATRRPKPTVPENGRSPGDDPGLQRKE